MSGLFGSVTIRGNRITDFANTTATVGIPRPFGYGTVPFDGNVIFAALPPKEHVNKKKQGKGGGVTSITYTYTQSYAVAFCKGPAFGFLWIKRNGKVVYTTDPNAPVADVAYAAKWKEKATFYLGTETQLPDSIIESYEGTGQVSGFRGDVYIVVEDDDVTEGGGATPTYEACVILNADAYFTTPTYPVGGEESFDHPVTIQGTSLVEGFIDHIDHSVSITGGALGEILEQYFNQPPDELDHTTSIASGELKDTLIEYTDGPPDELDHVVDVSAGELKNTLITYSNHPSDDLDHTVSITGGTLS